MKMFSFLKNKYQRVLLYILLTLPLLGIVLYRSQWNTIESIFVIMLAIQFSHSIEEQLMNFEEKWPLMRISGTQFWLFEIVFQISFSIIFLINNFIGKTEVMIFFIILMLANGVWHIVWFWFFEKGKYVPGLLTATLFIIAFFIHYYSTVTYIG